MPRRLLARSFWRAPATLAMVLLLAAAIFGAGVVSRYQSMDAVNHHQCVLILRLNGAIVDTLERSRKGLPSNTYYRRHPRELRNAVREVERSISRFKQINCNA